MKENKEELLKEYKEEKGTNFVQFYSNKFIQLSEEAKKEYKQKSDILNKDILSKRDDYKTSGNFHISIYDIYYIKRKRKFIIIFI